jgi:hypothetical protein
MKGLITLIAPDSPEPRVTEYTAEIPLDELQRLVGGYIELVPFWITVIKVVGHGVSTRVPCHVFCNEDGKRLQLPHNAVATALWLQAIAADYGHRGTPQGDYLVGPVAIVTGDAEFMDAL